MKPHSFLLAFIFLLPSSALAGFDFDNVIYHTCYDGDTCTMTIPGVHPLLGKRVPIRLQPVQAPEIRGKCEREKTLAIEARNFVRDLLSKARVIHLRDATRDDFFRIDARIIADGVDIGEVLLANHLAADVRHSPSPTWWCTPIKTE
ncbi:hypothetical protein [Candidatus Nitronereus thalassa]|uniref:TNase-like domain-containing protein n=1 Tax=Candidatus Nitronereus thalassa TaxID=3020898 RepID=A0ABU3K351_9BACT|nr:hypothetical protein [Candidatus Nitronereus thalassa]MDT7040825.1 hypothetical protein [Candidatus Nitronereus thalassa]